MAMGLPQDGLDRLSDAVARLDPRLLVELRQLAGGGLQSRPERIRDFYRCAEWRPWAELLMDLEEDAFARAALLDAVRFGREGGHKPCEGSQ
jgi:hypothetical protein